MDAYPLIFRFSSVVANDRFRARLRGTGRALAVFEDGEWWCAGVEPGGLTEAGASPVDAYLGFRRTLEEILQQLAEDSDSVQVFTERVGEFFLRADQHDRRRWMDAVEALRRKDSSLTQDVAALPREAAETMPQVEIEGANVFTEQKELLSLANPEPLPKAA